MDKLNLSVMKKCYLFCFIILKGIILFSQQPIVCEKKFYSAPDGHLYVNKDLPLYMSVSTSPD